MWTVRRDTLIERSIPDVSPLQIPTITLVVVERATRALRLLTPDTPVRFPFIRTTATPVLHRLPRVQHSLKRWRDEIALAICSRTTENQIPSRCRRCGRL